MAKKRKNRKSALPWILLVLVLILAGAAVYALAAEGVSEAIIEKIFPSPTPEPTPEPTPTPTPEPTPTPAPPVCAVYSAKENGAFTDALLGKGLRADFETASAEDTERLFEADAAVIAAESSADAALAERLFEAGVPVIVYLKTAARLPEAVPTVRFEGAGPATAKEALETAIAWPPHETPVRMFGLFASADGEAAAEWHALTSDGTILNKGTYTEGSSEDILSAWIIGRLNAYFPGMADAVFAETPALAEAFAEQMIAAGRDDLEIFTVGTSDALQAYGSDWPRLVPQLVSYDDALAGETCAEMLGQLLAGNAPESAVLSAGA